jgi:hypothetical protein
MKIIRLIISSAALFLSAALCRASVTTLVVGGTNSVAQLDIATNQVAEVVSHPYTGSGASVSVIKDGLAVPISPIVTINNPGFFQPVIVAGPASIRLVSEVPGDQGFCTIKVTPETFPPGNTLVIPADSKGAAVILESSTDLISWSSASPGVFTNLTANLFFRLRAERLP